MTIYGTNNPLGSMDPRDFRDNAQNLDFALNDITNVFWKDRFGRNRKSYFGMEQAYSAQLLSQQQRFNIFIQNSGYKVIGEYSEGPITIREYNQLIRHNNELWKLTAATVIPFTTTGNDAASWASDKARFVSVGDGALRQELDRSGVLARFGSRAELVSYAPGSNIADGLSVIAGGLEYIRDSTATSIPDLLGFKPPYLATLDHWGAPLDPTADATSYAQLALNWMALSPQNKIYEPIARTRKFDGSLNTAGHVNWDAGDATYLLDSANDWLAANGNANPTFYPLSGDYVAGSKALSVNLPRAPKRGEWVRIVSNAVNPADRSRLGNAAKYRIQEYARVGAGSTATSLVLDKPLRFIEGVNYDETTVVNPYSTAWNARVVLVDTSKKFRFVGGNFEYPEGKAYAPTILNIKAYHKPVIRRVNMTCAYASGVYLDGTLYAYVKGCNMQEFADNENGVQNGYGICDGGYFSRVENCTFGKCRHSYTTLRVSLADNSLEAFSAGNTVGGRVIGCKSQGATASHFDTHHGAVDIRFIDCEAEGGTSIGFSGRGIDCAIIQCISLGIDGNAVYIQTETTGIAGGLDRYTPSWIIKDCDLHGTREVAAFRWCRVKIKDTTFRSNTLRQLIISSSNVKIQGTVKFLTEDMNGAYPIVQPTSSFPVAISIDATKPLLNTQTRLEVEHTAQLDFSLNKFTTLPNAFMNIAAGSEFHLFGKLRLDLPPNVLLNGQGPDRINTVPCSEIELVDASADFGTWVNKARAYTTAGVQLISGTEYSGPAGDGYIVKEPSGAMRAYGDKDLGSRKFAGAGSFADPYTTTVMAISLGATFISAPTVALQYKVTTGAASDLRRGVVAFDSVNTNTIGGVRGHSLSAAATDATVLVGYHAEGRWK